MFRRFLAIAAIFGMVALASPAEAQVEVDGISGTWGAAVPAADGIGTNEITWGNPLTSAGESGYRFDPATTPFTPTVDSPFVLGMFTHFNNPILAPSITAAQLDFALTLGSGAVPSLFEQSFTFNHFETPNGAEPCADGGVNGVGVNVNGCADRVTFGFTGGIATPFVAGGQSYFLEILGFQVGGEVVEQFWTVEAQNNEAELIARFTTRNPVPGPAPMALLATGMLGLVGIARRRTSE